MGTPKNLSLLYTWILALLSHIVFGQTVNQAEANWSIRTEIEAKTALIAAQEAAARQAWFDKSKLYVGIREKTNRNDHDSIAVFNRHAGVAKNSPYCAAGLYYTAHLAGLHFTKIKHPAAVKYWFIEQSIIWSRSTKRWKANAQFMDSIWIFGSHIEALAQPTLRRDIEDDDRFLTLGFNTSGNTGKQGVYHPITRRWRDVKHVGNPFKLL